MEDTHDSTDISDLAQQVVAELESGRYGDKFVLSRRQLIALAGSGLSVGALMSFGVSEAQAQDAVGAVGTESEPIDVYGDTLSANSAEINGTATAEALEAGSVSTEVLNTDTLQVGYVHSDTEIGPAGDDGWGSFDSTTVSETFDTEFDTTPIVVAELEQNKTDEVRRIRHSINNVNSTGFDVDFRIYDSTISSFQEIQYVAVSQSIDD